MSPPQQRHALPTRTASSESSIWIEPTENSFREKVVELEKLTNAVPLDSQIFDWSKWSANHPSSSQHNARLCPAEEQRLADDISYLAAVGEGAQSVAAATVQEPSSSPPTAGAPTLRVTIASVDAIDSASQSFLRSLFDVLSEISVATKDDAVHVLFTQVARHHRQRLLNRLRSARWTKPAYLSRTHKKPLHADFPNLIHRAEFLYARNERRQRSEVEANLSSLASVLHSFETPPPDDDPGREDERRCNLIRACYDFCVLPSTADYLRRLRSVRPTAQVQACLKTLQQTEKIAAYYRIALTLADLALSHCALFASVELVFLPPYEAVPVELAYQPWAASAHVHAEVNLAVHHDVTRQIPGAGSGPWRDPRCVGASKYLCYLCYLFLCRHGAYFPSKTHGACYDQWTIPDLADYPDDLRGRYREVVRGMAQDVSDAVGHATRRIEPMTSRENLILSADSFDG